MEGEPHLSVTLEFLAERAKHLVLECERFDRQKRNLGSAEILVSSRKLVAQIEMELLREKQS